MITAISKTAIVRGMPIIHLIKNTDYATIAAADVLPEETIGRVAGGAVASRILECLGIKLTTYTKAIGPVSIPSDAYDYSVINENRLYMPNSEYAQQAAAYLEQCISDQDSSGGLIECIIEGMPAGVRGARF